MEINDLTRPRLSSSEEHHSDELFRNFARETDSEPPRPHQNPLVEVLENNETCHFEDFFQKINDDKNVVAEFEPKRLSRNPTDQQSKDTNSARQIPTSELPYSAVEFITGETQGKSNDITKQTAAAVEISRLETPVFKPKDNASAQNNTCEPQNLETSKAQPANTGKENFAEQVPTIDNQRPSQHEPPPITPENETDTSNYVEVYLSNEEYMQHLKLKAISLDAPELTRAEAQILVDNDMVTFPGKKTLKRSLKYKCQICLALCIEVRTFKYPYQLLQHMRCHINDKPFHCKECNKSFTRSSNLNAHIRKNHEKI
ncbi:unnamed protein product [Oikopleura dioica]|uniref:C2H2-type domain-containing protein n=1 Tax=Oikopleura dioica TaxID=34765 RepID=E4XPH4_OIKDI|nr:unnamed protein product [Oikopleura dioica]